MSTGSGLIDFDYACRWPNGSMKNINGASRKVLYCPSCQFAYKEAGCIFTQVHRGGAFGRNASTAPEQLQVAGGAIRATGGRWSQAAILESIVDYHEKNGVWPKNTTVFRGSSRLPHSVTVKRQFGSIGCAVGRAQDMLARGEYETL